MNNPAYSKKRHDTRDRLYEKLGVQLLYKVIYGENIVVKQMPRRALVDYEGIDCKVSFLDGKTKPIYVSDRLRPAISEGGMDLRQLDDITVRTRNAKEKLLEISNMAAEDFIYAIANIEETNWERWYVVDIQRLLKLYFEGKLKHKSEIQNKDGNWFAPIAVEELHKFNLIKQQKGGLPPTKSSFKKYDKQSHLVFLQSLVDDIKRKDPEENIYVDRGNVQIVWGVQHDFTKKEIKTTGLEDF